MFDWNDLKYFLAVARSGSTLAAARNMNFSQSTVQRRLIELERCLGQRLVTRHSKGYRLTALGEELLTFSENVEQAAMALERHVAASVTELEGTIRLTCPEALVNRLISAGLLDVFQTRYPGLKVKLVMSDRFMDLANGEADIAIRAGELSGDDLIARKLAVSPWAVYASRSYIERYGRPRSQADLNTHLVVDFDGPLASHRAALWLRRVAPDARSIAHNNSIPGLIQAVRAGLGATPLPIALGEENNLVQLFEPVPELTTSWYMLVHRDMRHTPRITAFFDFVIEEIDLIRPILTGQAGPDKHSSSM